MSTQTTTTPIGWGVIYTEPGALPAIDEVFATRQAAEDDLTHYPTAMPERFRLAALVEADQFAWLEQDAAEGRRLAEAFVQAFQRPDSWDATEVAMNALKAWIDGREVAR